MRATGLLLLILMAGFAQARAQSDAQPPSEADQLLALLNQDRAAARLKTVTLDPTLSKAAQKHTQRMADEGELSHQFPHEPELSERVAAAGARFSAVAENVASSDSVPHAERQWMESPGHRANMLNPLYDSVGIGIVHESDGQLYLTEDFAKLVPGLTLDQLEDKIFGELNDLRSHHRLNTLQRKPISMLREDACRQEISARGLAQSLSSTGWVTILTGSDPAVLPEEVKKVALHSNTESVALGACYLPNTEGFSSFRLIAVFFRAP